MSSDVTSINVGSVANDGTGDAIRTAFQTVNTNFSRIDNRISTGNLGVVYSGTSIQANIALVSLASTTTQTLEVISTANISGNTRIGNLTVNNSFISTTITSTGNTNAIGGLRVTGPADFGNNVVIQGNLTVLGNNTIVSSTDMVVQDSIINLHTSSTLAPLIVDDGKDIGIKFHYYKGADKHAALVWANDSQALEFYADGVESAGNTFTGTYGNVKIGSLFLSNSTATTSTTTGALLAVGGIASQANVAALNFLGNLYGTKANVGNLSVSGYIQGPVYLAGTDTIYINGSPVVTSATSFAGGTVPGYALFQSVLEGRGNIFANSQTASSSTTTGALVVNGGVGISGDVYIGGALSLPSIQNTPVGTTTPALGTFTTLKATGNIVAASITESYKDNYTTGSFVSLGGAVVQGNLYVGGSINGTFGTYNPAAGNFTSIGLTTKGSGAFTTLTTTQTVIASGNIVAASSTASHSTTTGALVVVGGAGIAGKVSAGSLVTANAVITGGSITGITGQASTFTTTNFSTGNAAITGGSVTGITGAASTFTATNFSTGNAAITGGSVTGITGSATTFTVANLSSGNAQITATGTLTGTATTANVGLYNNVTLTTTNASYYLKFTDRNTTGNSASYIAAGLSFNPSTNNLTTTTFTGTHSGTAAITSGSVTGITGSASYFTATNLSSGNLQVSGAITPNANATVNLGSTSAWFATIYGVSSQAKYADLAEMYAADQNYSTADVLIFGGEHEVTTSTEFADTRVAGPVSNNPAYLMNAELTNGCAIALRGRVPVKVEGPVAKGDLLVTGNVAGHATSVGRDRTFGSAVFAKALEDKTDNGLGQIEAVIL